MPGPLEQYYNKTLEELLANPPPELLGATGKKKRRALARVIKRARQVELGLRPTELGGDPAGYLGEADRAIEVFLKQWEARATPADERSILESILHDPEFRLAPEASDVFLRYVRAYLGQFPELPQGAFRLEAVLADPEFKRGLADLVALTAAFERARQPNATATDEQAYLQTASATASDSLGRRVFLELNTPVEEAQPTGSFENAWFTVQRSIASYVEADPQLAALQDTLIRWMDGARTRLESEFKTSGAGDFTKWFEQNYSDDLGRIAQGVAPIQQGFDGVLDPLLDSVMGALPWEAQVGLGLRGALKDALAAFQSVSGVQDKAELWRRFGFDKARDVLSRRIEDTLRALPGGGALADIARQASINLLDQAMLTQEGGAVADAEDIIANIAAQLGALSPEAAQAARQVQEATRGRSMVTARVIEGLLGDSLNTLPAYVRGLVLSGALETAKAHGFGDAPTQQDFEALSKLFGRPEAFLTQAIASSLRAALGETAYKQLAESAGGIGLAGFLAGLPTDIYTQDAFIAAVQAQAELQPGRTPLASALSRYTLRLKALPFAVTQSVEDKLDTLIAKFLPLFPGMEPEEILALPEFQAEADIAVQAAMDALVGDDELAAEVIGLYGGLEGFFRALGEREPGLREMDAKTLAEWIGKNAARLIQLPGADTTEATRLIEARALVEREEAVGTRERELSVAEREKQAAFAESVLGKRGAEARLIVEEEGLAEKGRGTLGEFFTSRLQAQLGRFLFAPNVQDVFADIGPQAFREFVPEFGAEQGPLGADVSRGAVEAITHEFITKRFGPREAIRALRQSQAGRERAFAPTARRQLAPTLGGR